MHRYTFARVRHDTLPMPMPRTQHGRTTSCPSSARATSTRVQPCMAGTRRLGNWPPHSVEDFRVVACRDARLSLQANSRQRRTTKQWVGERNNELPPPTDGMPDNHDCPGLNLNMNEWSRHRPVGCGGREGNWLCSNVRRHVGSGLLSVQ